MILITGITGRVGSVAADKLLQQGYGVRGVTREREKATSLAAKGANVIVGNIAEPQVIEQALAGVDTVIMVTGNGPAQADIERGVARYAHAQAVRHLIKISSMEAGPDATTPISRLHYEIEQYIAELGITATFLRPNFFMQNLLLFANSIKTSDSFSLPLGKARTGIVDANDIGEAAATLAMVTPQTSSTRVLTGERLLDFYEVARRLSAVLGRDISYREQSPAEFHQHLAKTIPSPWHVEAVALLFKEIAGGALESVTTDLQDILGREAASIEDFVRRFESVFS